MRAQPGKLLERLLGGLYIDPLLLPSLVEVKCIMGYLTSPSQNKSCFCILHKMGGASTLLN